MSGIPFPGAPISGLTQEQEAGYGGVIDHDQRERNLRDAGQPAKEPDMSSSFPGKLINGVLAGQSSAVEFQPPVTDTLVLDMLVAAGFVSAEKVKEARAFAEKFIGNKDLPRTAMEAQVDRMRERKMNIEEGAKVLADQFDYPWEHMPEQGRDSMRKTVVLVMAALRKGA